jgi:chromosome segregation ATPase
VQRKKTMPKLKNLRVINAQFNEGKGMYQDFLMPFDGLSATYELINGGGKSVLVMLLLQCIMPKSHLDPKKPFKAMFDGGDPNRTTHVLAEWELDEGLCEHKYLLTGFCAKKKDDPDDVLMNEGVNHFNYVHLYDKPNDLDIFRIPLCKLENEEFVVMDFSKTLSMLREKSGNFDIWIADTIREYQERIKEYNLLEAEWKLVRNINKDENHLKAYFGGNYGTSRTLVEKLLINTTDECLRDKRRFSGEDSEEKSSESLASALYQSQEDLKRLREEVERVKEYKILYSEVNGLIDENDRVIESHQKLDESKHLATSQYQAHNLKATEVHEDLEKARIDLDETKRLHEKVELDIERNELMQLNIKVNKGRTVFEELSAEKEGVEKSLQNLKYKYNFATATNKYLEIQNLESEIREDRNTLENIRHQHDELFSKRDSIGKGLFLSISEDLDFIEAQYETEKNAKDEILCTIGDLQLTIGELNTTLKVLGEEISRYEDELKNMKNRESSLNNQYVQYPRITCGLVIEDEIGATEKHIEELEEQIKQLSSEIELLKSSLSTSEMEIKLIQIQINNNEENIEKVRDDILKYESDRRAALDIVRAREEIDIESCFLAVKKEIADTHELLSTARRNHEKLKQELRRIQEYGFALSEDFEYALTWLRDHFRFARSGTEYLKDLDAVDQKKLLDNAPWLPKAIILANDDFNAIVKNPWNRLSTKIMDSSVILTGISSIQENKKVSLGDVFVPSRDAEYYVNALNRENAIKLVEKEINSVEQQVFRYKNSFEVATNDSEILSFYIRTYPETYESEMKSKLSEYESLKKERENKLFDIRKKIEADSTSLEQTKSSLLATQAKKEKIKEKLRVLTDLIKVMEEIEEKKRDLEQSKSVLNKTEGQQREKKILKSQLEIEFKDKESLVQSLNLQKSTLDKDMESFEQYRDVDADVLLEKNTDLLRSEWNSVNKVLNQVSGNIEQIEERITKNGSLIEVFLKDIKNAEVSIESIEASRRSQPYPDDYLESLKNETEKMQATLEDVDSRLRKASDNLLLLKKDFEDKCRKYNAKSGKAYSLDPCLIDSTLVDEELSKCKKESYRLIEKIGKLTDLCQNMEKEFGNLEKSLENYKILSDLYNLEISVVEVAIELISHTEIQGLLKNTSEDVERSKRKFNIAKEKFLNKVVDLPVAPYFKDVVKQKLRVANTLREAESNANALRDYSNTITSRMEMHQKQVDTLKSVEENIVAQALGIAMLYRDYLHKFVKLSKIDVDGTLEEMVRINFNECEYSEERAESEMRYYIQELIQEIEVGNIGKKELINYLTPAYLINKVLDMKLIKLDIRKIDRNSLKFQRWEKIQASGGQENAMYIIFLVVLMSYIRDIVVDRRDKNTSKVLVIDNPFGTTSSYYLWEKIWSILEKNNVQLICPGHKIGTNVMEFFPINHLLTEEISSEGRTRIGIQVRAKSEILDRIERQKRGGQLSISMY